MGEAKRAARKAEDSEPVAWLARLGLLSRGLIWLIIGALAAQVAFGGDDRVDKNGALHAIAEKPLGELLLVVLAVGFLGYAAWRLLEGAVGHRDQEAGRKRWSKRGSSLFRGGIYLFLAGSTAKYVVTGGSNDQTQPITARVMSHTGGRTLVFLVGAGIVIGGLAMAVRAFRQKFEDNLKTGAMPEWLQSATKLVGTTGLAARGLVFVLIGGFLVKAALDFDPDKAKGLDASLKALAHQSYGTALLFAAALGLLAFAVWSFVEARYRDI